MLKKVLVLAVLLFAIQPSIYAQESKLKDGKESLKSNSSSSNSSTIKNDSSSNSSDATNNDSTFGGFFAEIFIKLFAYTAYAVAVELPYGAEGKMRDAELSNHAYKDGNTGNYIQTDSTNYNITRFDISNNFVIENKNLYGTNFDVNFRFLKRFALDVNYVYLFEKVANSSESFTMYSALLKYHRIRTQRFDAWYGLGITHIGSDVNKSSFSFGVGAEWFIKKPVSLDFSHKWTNINQQEVHNTRMLLKFYIKNYQIFSGYEHFKIGVSKIGTFSLGLGASF